MVSLNQLVLAATILYSLLDGFLGISVPFYVYLGFFLFTIVNALLLHFDYLEASKVFGLLTFNIMIFLVATSEPFATGMYLHYVTAGTVALALYGYEQWKGALRFATLSLTLHILTFTLHKPIITWREATPSQAKVFFVLNTLIVAGVCVYTIMHYSKLNHEAEQALKESGNVIRKQNEELIKANQELDRFVYSASHDLRSPLSTLTGLINLSKQEKDDRLKSEYLELMNGRIQSMNTFISEIIDYSRNSRVAVARESVNIKALIKSIVDDLYFPIENKTIDFIWEINDDLVVVTDASRIKIVFSNLISNAIKYHDPAKRPSWVKLKAEKTQDKMHLMVEDNGIGIGGGQKDKIFEMFYRAHEHSNGSGLGLYIVKEALAKLDGHIAVESCEGKG